MIGSTINHYTIIEKLGEGGMGVVYKAEDTKLKRTVALKFLPPDLTRDQSAKERFLLEAQAASVLDHPNICAVHEIGETSDHGLFIVMPYYEGETLKEKIARGPFPLDEAIDIALQVASGVAKAHAHEITHRDIKPGNIIVTTGGMAKILDFGLAKLAGRTKVTRTGRTLGTAAYMSPEQALGEKVDERTDIWSFGVVLYEMLTGQLPFKSEYESALVYSILNENPKPVSALRPEVPPELEAVVKKCMEKEPGKRYQDISGLQADLLRLKGAPVSAELVWSMARAKIRAHWIPSVATLAAILAAAIYFLFLGAPAGTGERIRIAVADVVNETKEENLNGLSGLFTTAFEQSPSVTVLTRSSMFDALRRMGRANVETIDEQSARDVCNYAGVNALLTVSIRKLGQRYIMDLKVLDPQKDEHLFAAVEESPDQDQIYSMINKLTVKARRETFGEAEDQILKTSRNVAEMTTGNLDAYQHYFQGLQLIQSLRWDDAEEEFQRAVALDTTFALAQYRLAYVRSWQMRLGVGTRGIWVAIDAALRHIDQVPERDRMMIRAFDAAKRGRTDNAIAAYREIVDKYGDDKEAHFEIGDLLFHKPSSDSALPHFEKAVALDPQRFGEAYYHVTMILRTADRYGEALAYGKQWLAFIPGEEAYSGLALTYNRMGEFHKAIETHEIAQKLYPTNPDPAIGIGYSYIHMEEYEKAAMEFRKLLQRPNPARTRSRGYESLSTVYAFLGKYQEALRMIDERIKIETALGDSVGLAQAYASKAFWLAVGTRNRQEATIALEKAFSIVSARLWIRPLRISVYVVMRQYEKVPQVPEWYRPYVNASAYRSKGDYAAAIAEFERLPHYPQVHFTFHLGELYFEVGRYDDASRMLSKMQKMYIEPPTGGVPAGFWRPVNYPRSFFLMAKIHEKKGNTKLAIENYEKFLHLWKDADKDLPELVEAKERLANLKEG
ncbi:MAG: protein kinase [Ignavibacteriales bacterium]|nr:protein kinase [Ignavibacteriales bacterium]